MVDFTNEPRSVSLASTFFVDVVDESDHVVDGGLWKDPMTKIENMAGSSVGCVENFLSLDE